MISLLALSLLATTPDATRSLAQVEKQALEIQSIAQRLQSQILISQQAGRPLGLSVLESDVATLSRHLKRLEAAISELDQALIDN
jgi:prefoldin subunit 5